MRTLPSLLATVAALAAAGWLTPGPAFAGHDSKNCGLISKGSHDYRVQAGYMACKKARRASKRYLRTGQPRPGFDCAPTGEHGFYCQDNGQDPIPFYSAIRL